MKEAVRVKRSDSRHSVFPETQCGAGPGGAVRGRAGRRWQSRVSASKAKGEPVPA